jgi:hypothetical protein
MAHRRFGEGEHSEYSDRVRRRSLQGGFRSREEDERESSRGEPWEEGGREEDFGRFGEFGRGGRSYRGRGQHSWQQGREYSSGERYSSHANEPSHWGRSSADDRYWDERGNQWDTEDYRSRSYGTYDDPELSDIRYQDPAERRIGSYDDPYGGYRTGGRASAPHRSGRPREFRGYGDDQRRGERESSFAGTRLPEFGRFAGRGPKGYQRADERIREDVCDRLTDDPDIDASDLTVQVKNCEVTLEGTVQDRQTKRRAEDCAEAVPGVKQVHNRLQVSPNGHFRQGFAGMGGGQPQLR